MIGKIKTKFNFLFIALLTIIVLYFSLKDNFNDIMNLIFSMNVYWFIVAILLMISYWFLRTIPLYIFIREFKKDYSFLKVFRLILKTQFFNGVTPFASGGQPFEIIALKKDNISIPNGTNIIIQNFIVYQIALILLGVFAISYNHFFNVFKEVGLLKQLVTIGFIVNLLVTIGLFMIAFMEKFNNLVISFLISILTKLKIVKNKEEKTKEWHKYTNNFHNGAKRLIKNKKKFVVMVFLNIASLCALYLIPLVILFSIGDYRSLNSIDSIVATSYVMLMGSFVPMPGGTGGLEYGFVEFFKNFISGASLSAIMIMWRFTTYYFGIILGAITLNIKERKS